MTKTVIVALLALVALLGAACAGETPAAEVAPAADGPLVTVFRNDS